MLTDEQLIKKIKKGDKEAMEKLVKKHYNFIFAYVFRKINDYHLAYDLTQEVFIKMLTSLDNYRRKNRFKNWLITIAVNHCRDYFRSRAFKERGKEQKLYINIEEESKGPWDLVQEKETGRQIQSALQKLPDFQKEAIILRYYHDFKIREIADITNSNESTVKSRLRQGTLKLAQILNGGVNNA